MYKNNLIAKFTILRTLYSNKNEIAVISKCLKKYTQYKSILQYKCNTNTIQIIQYKC